ncbi:F-box protein PP2-A15-like [Nymphaea colorata]|uniref:F-box protein PP2-A15-like n=1 Tax=Nymphaea colorata TaxID=210225 RepID=UPI00129E3676|nr:F-box protein PP2-A15-like [Nymphaea colorata]
MGANLTSLTDGNGDSLKPGLRDIPESCVAAVFMYLSPPEICKLARLNRSFRNAASADFVWESKLPANYRFLLAKLFPDPLDSLSKKEIFAVLSRPHPFDAGSKEVWLEKTTGAVCLAVSSKAMSITGIDDRRYWNFILTDESRFHAIAYLQQIWWFEVDGEFEFQFPAGTYSLFFRLQLGKPTKRLGRRVCNFDHVHGWDLKPVRFQVSTSDSQHASCQCFLEDPEKNGNEGITKHIRGSWMNYHVGDFVVSSSNIPTKIKFSMTQIDCTHSKGGLCVDCVLIYPSNFTEKGKYF